MCFDYKVLPKILFIFFGEIEKINVPKVCTTIFHFPKIVAFYFAKLAKSKLFFAVAQNVANYTLNKSFCEQTKFVYVTFDDSFFFENDLDLRFFVSFFEFHSFLQISLISNPIVSRGR